MSSLLYSRSNNNSGNSSSNTKYYHQSKDGQHHGNHGRGGKDGAVALQQDGTSRRGTGRSDIMSAAAMGQRQTMVGSENVADIFDFNFLFPLPGVGARHNKPFWRKVGFLRMFRFDAEEFRTEWKASVLFLVPCTALVLIIASCIFLANGSHSNSAYAGAGGTQSNATGAQTGAGDGGGMDLGLDLDDDDSSTTNTIREISAIVFLCVFIPILLLHLIVYCQGGAEATIDEKFKRVGGLARFYSVFWALPLLAAGIVMACLLRFQSGIGFDYILPGLAFACLFYPLWYLVVNTLFALINLFLFSVSLSVFLAIAPPVYVLRVVFLSINRLIDLVLHLLYGIPDTPRYCPGQGRVSIVFVAGTFLWASLSLGIAETVACITYVSLARFHTASLEGLAIAFLVTPFAASAVTFFADFYYEYTMVWKETRLVTGTFLSCLLGVLTFFFAPFLSALYNLAFCRDEIFRMVVLLNDYFAKLKARHHAFHEREDTIGRSGRNYQEYLSRQQNDARMVHDARQRRACVWGLRFMVVSVLQCIALPMCFFFGCIMGILVVALKFVAQAVALYPAVLVHYIMVHFRLFFLFPRSTALFNRWVSFATFGFQRQKNISAQMSLVSFSNDIALATALAFSTGTQTLFQTIPLLAVHSVNNTLAENWTALAIVCASLLAASLFLVLLQGTRKGISYRVFNFTLLFVTLVCPDGSSPRRCRHPPSRPISSRNSHSPQAPPTSHAPIVLGEQTNELTSQHNAAYAPLTVLDGPADDSPFSRTGTQKPRSDSIGSVLSDCPAPVRTSPATKQVILATCAERKRRRTIDAKRRSTGGSETFLDSVMAMEGVALAEGRLEAVMEDADSVEITSNDVLHESCTEHDPADVADVDANEPHPAHHHRDCDHDNVASPHASREQSRTGSNDPSATSNTNHRKMSRNGGARQPLSREEALVASREEEHLSRQAERQPEIEPHFYRRDSASARETAERLEWDDNYLSASPPHQGRGKGRSNGDHKRASFRRSSTISLEQTFQLSSSSLPDIVGSRNSFPDTIRAHDAHECGSDGEEQEWWDQGGALSKSHRVTSTLSDDDWLHTAAPSPSRRKDLADETSSLASKSSSLFVRSAQHSASSASDTHNRQDETVV